MLSLLLVLSAGTGCADNATPVIDASTAGTVEVPDDIVTPNPVTAEQQQMVEDEDSTCSEWAAAGECIRNPQYMLAECADACNAQVYLDIETDCMGWANDGECEKNPGFMLNKCNSSCMTLAKRSLHETHRPHANPNIVQDEPGHRAQTFVPIFCLIALMVAGYAMAVKFFGSSLTVQQEKLEEAVNRGLARLQRKYPRLEGITNVSASTIGSGMICLYYINEGLTVVQTNPLLASLLSFFFETDGVWQHHVAWIDATNVAGAVAAALCLFVRWRPMQCAYVMMADTLVDSFLLLWRIMLQWLFGRGLYINELMAKKFSLLGCVAMMIAVQHQAKERTSSSLLSAGLLDGSVLSNNISVAVLIGRLLIAVLFLYVGLHELHRLLFEPFTPYLPGDGHDVVWPKAVELLLSVPFILGFETVAVARLLAFSLVLEAFYAWSWWTIPGDSHSFAAHRRAIHYREHFVTNIATAGGLLLLQKIGAGKYSVDELLKKKD